MNLPIMLTGHLAVSKANHPQLLGNGYPGSAKRHPQLLGNGYNNYRINFLLRYLSPDEYRQNTFKKVV